ncbi:hypothetical protein FACS1894132_02110 [Clostridia bacterium]|nr:hypothetical protein FACS1894132_02110 [Clostridia bacterium]
MNNLNAIYNGGLTDKYQFFGSGTAETIATATALGSWDGGNASSVYSTSPWARRGGQSPIGSGAGSFAFDRETGDVNNGTSHRTILSGY